MLETGVAIGPGVADGADVGGGGAVEGVPWDVGPVAIDSCFTGAAAC